MTPETIFSLTSGLAGLAWIFLICGARCLPKAFRVVRYALPVILGLVYLICLSLAGSVEGGGFSSLKEVGSLFQNDWALLAGWIHYLAFDFFIGCWILNTAKKEEINHYLIIIPMILTFMLGPAGLLLFLIIRGWKNRRLITKRS